MFQYLCPEALSYPDKLALLLCCARHVLYRSRHLVEWAKIHPLLLRTTTGEISQAHCTHGPEQHSCIQNVIAAVGMHPRVGFDKPRSRALMLEASQASLTCWLHTLPKPSCSQ